jgi:hypothetical protein
MKILKLTTVALSVIILGVTSCKKEEQIEETKQTSEVENPFPNHLNDFLSLKLNSNQLSVNTTYIAEEFGGITVTSINRSGPNVGIKIQKLPVGTYNILSPNNFGRVSISNGQTAATSNSFQSNGSGSVTIIEHNTSNKFIKGIFNFIATDNNGNNPQVVTNGYFQANY